MSEFVVSARKYRPLEWEDVVGQGSITDTLKNAIASDKLAHAYLFCGPRGVGKTTCARIFAKKINQSEGDESQDFAFNIFELDAASNNSVDDIRNLIDQVRVPPQTGKYKVYVIDEVHMLSSSAFNAFLKTLEEPPPHAIFILATTEKHKILPTILSRCQIYDFNRISVKDIAGHLKSISEKESFEYDDDGLMAIARKADGALRDALSIFDQVAGFSDGKITYQAVADNLGILDLDMFFNVTDAISAEDIHKALLAYHETLENGFESHQFLLGLAEHYRNLIMAANPATVNLIEMAEETQDRYKEQLSKMDIAQIMKGLEVLGEADSNYRQSKNKRLLVELTIMQLCSIKAHQKKKPESVLIIPPKGVPINIKKTPEESAPNKTPEPKTAVASEVKEEVKKAYPEKPDQVNKPKAKPAFSISGALSQKKSQSSSQSTATEPQQKKAPQFNRSTEEVNDDKLQKAWSKYAESVRSAGKQSFYSTLKQRKPTLKGNKITFTINNAVQEEDLSLNRTEMLEFLRKELRNFKVGLEWKVEESNQEAHLYTPTDKFNKMAEKNPSLKKLRQRFDLDIDF